MYGIKYFFLNKNNQIIHGSKKFFRDNKLLKTLPKNTIFQNLKVYVLPWRHLGPPPLRMNDKRGQLKYVFVRIASALKAEDIAVMANVLWYLWKARNEEVIQAN
jgi:hypothetical protein